MQGGKRNERAPRWCDRNKAHRIPDHEGQREDPSKGWYYCCPGGYVRNTCSG